jgi:hypothetical protein
MLWAALLHSEGRLDARLLRHLGADGERLRALAEAYPGEIEKLRWLRLAGLLFSRESLAALYRARLGEILMGAAKAGEMLALCKAFERMPDWLWGEDEDGQAGAPGPGRGEEEAAAAAMQRLRGMLSGGYGGDGPVSEAQIERAQRLADRLDDFAVAPRPGHASSTRGGARRPPATKKRTRRQ